MFMHILNVGVGMTFSGGLIDLTLFGILQGNAKTNWIYIVAVGNAIKQIEADCAITIAPGSFAYSRLMYHIRYMIDRIIKNEKLNSDMIDYTKTHCAYAFRIATSVCEKLDEELGKAFSEREVSYLALHIERMRMMEEPAAE